MRQKNPSWWLVVPAALCASAACARGSQSPSPTYATNEQAPPPAAEPTPVETAAHADCPMDVQGAVVNAEDIDGGVALVFTTQSGDVPDLKARISRIAQSVEQSAVPASPRPGPIPITKEPLDAEHGKMLIEITGNVPVQANVIELPDGARLELRASTATDIETLRLRVRENATQMAAGTCPGAPDAG